MPQSADESVQLTVSLLKPIHDELQEWARSVLDESPEDFLELFANTLMADQALRDHIAGTYFGGA